MCRIFFFSAVDCIDMGEYIKDVSTVVSIRDFADHLSTDVNVVADKRKWINDLKKKFGDYVGYLESSYLSKNVNVTNCFIDCEIPKKGRRSKLFLITFDVDCNFIRENVLLLFDDIAEYVISIESSKTTSLVDKHCHCFLNFREGYYLSEIRSVFLNSGLLVNDNFDVQTCRSSRNVKKYITKEDINALHNCSVDQLHLVFQTHHWVVRNKYFKYTDPFVVQHANRYRFLIEYHQDFWINRLTFLKFYPFEGRFNNWADNCIEWWNNFISTTGRKRKQLYVRGPTGVGKTSLIEKLIGSYNMSFVYYPDVGKFMLDSYRADFHRIILFEEFNLQYYPEDFLKRLCEGARYAFPVKCKSSKLVVHNGPIIFVSNNDNNFSDAMLARLEIVEAETPWFSSSLVSSEETCLEEENF